MVLNQGETYQFWCFSAGDVTGSTVSSDKPVAVSAGNGCGNVPFDTPFCDLMTEMLFPTALYDTEGTRIATLAASIYRRYAAD